MLNFRISRLVFVAVIVFSGRCAAQVNYVARFELDKNTFLLGEPIFGNFVIENTGTQTFTFSYRFPSRVLNRELGQEPRFRVSDERGRVLPDPAPQPCGGAKGDVVYGSATVPPGQKHTEPWLLNQWARFSHPGRYRIRAERRLPLLVLDPVERKFSKRPAAYATAINEFTLELLPSSDGQLRAVFQPYLKTLDDPSVSNPAESVLVLTALPETFFLEKLTSMANAASRERRWDRKQILEGLARLNTRAAWDAISSVARGSGPESLRAYAILLLAEKGDKTFLPGLLEMVRNSSTAIRGDILRGLGFFHDPRANRVLFERLHAANASDRMNAILGLKNLESREAIPALLAMLNDPNPRVLQVANFSLQSLTGRNVKLPATASREEAAEVRERWRAWWRDKGATAPILHQPSCHDW